MKIIETFSLCDDVDDENTQKMHSLSVYLRTSDSRFNAVDEAVAAPNQNPPILPNKAVPGTIRSDLFDDEI